MSHIGKSISAIMMVAVVIMMRIATTTSVASAFCFVPTTTTTTTSSIPSKAAIPSSSQNMILLAETSETTEYGYNMDQQAMMESDMLIVVDENDVLIGTGNDNNENENDDDDIVISKKQAHSFSKEQPRGICHRAFSFFLFNQEGKLLLTQRAGTKITFPNVWTNTCCSHPLVGMKTPFHDEVDIVPDAYPQFDGIKHAAIRKIKHELGITTVEHDTIQFISRFHYWASDTATHGMDSPWGEHEVDYILFCQMQNDEEEAKLTIDLDPEEVSQYKFVSVEELEDMLNDPDLTWSPWFLGMLQRGIFDWWKDLDGAMKGKYTNEDVTFFDPEPQFVANYNLPTHSRKTGVWGTLNE